MTPKEIVERVKAARWNPHAGPEPMIHRDYIDHLLAIHAAVVEMFEARQGYFRSTSSEARMIEARANLAALCGWKAEEP